MKNKIKLSLDDLKVESFMTSKEIERIHGGNYTYETGCCTAECMTTRFPTQCNYGTGTPTTCNTEPYPCQSGGTGGTGTGTGQTDCGGCGGSPTVQGCATSAATCNYTNYGTCTCAPQTADYTACYC